MEGKRFHICNLCGKVIDVNLDPDFIEVDYRHYKAYYHKKCIGQIQENKENLKDDK